MPFFGETLREFVDWNILNNEEKVGCPVVFYEEINAML